MKTMTLVLGLLLLGNVLHAGETRTVKAEASDSRMLAGQKDFNKDYLEKVSDEKAAEKLRREADRKNHDKYLLQIDRSR